MARLGSGQLLNEGIAGSDWPPKDERNARLRECAQIMRALWCGETVTHRGRVTVEEATLFTRPAEPPLLIGAALSAETARWLGGWADGLITIAGERAKMAAVVDAFRRGGGEGKPMFLQVQISYAASEEEALRGAWEEWRPTILGGPVQSELRTPAMFEAAARFVTPEDVRGPVRVSADPQRHIDWLRGDLEMGFERLFLHNVNREQQRFIDDFGERVLPALRG